MLSHFLGIYGPVHILEHLVPMRGTILHHPKVEYNKKGSLKMKKISWIIVILVIVGFSTASVLGYQNASASANMLQSPESARDLAVNYILQNHKELSLTAPEAWDCQNLTPELLGGSTLEYTAGGWKVTVSYLVVLEPTYAVNMTYSGEVGFQWVGTVTSNGTVTETDFTAGQ